MSDLEVSESVLAIPMAYNSQQTNPSKYQKRTINYLYPSQNTPLNSVNNSLIYRFLVPAEGFLDSKNSFISTEAYIYRGTNVNSQTPLDPAERAFFSSYTDTWIKRVTLLTSTGVKIEEVLDANVLASMMKRELEPAFINSIGKESLALWDSSTVGNNSNSNLSPEEKMFYSMNQQSNVSNPNRFVIPLKMSGFLQSFNYLPLKAMSQGQSNAFQIEIEFADPKNMITAYKTAEGTAADSVFNYIIQSCYYSMQLIRDDEKEAEIMEIIKTTPLILSYQTHNHYANTLTNTGGTTQNTINVTEYQESLSEVKFCFRNNANTDVQSIPFGLFSNPNLGQIQLQVGNMYLPSQPTPMGKKAGNANVYIPLTAEQYVNSSICAQKWGKEVKGFRPSVTRVTASDATKFGSSPDYVDLMVYFNLRVFQDDAVGDSLYNQYTSGINTKNNPVPLQFIFTNLFGITNYGDDITLFNPSTTTPTGYIIDSFTTYRSNLVIQRGETYVIS